MEQRYYESIDPKGELICQKCGIPLVKGKVQLSYLGNAFPVELPMCPECHFVYVPEELALGKILKVERSLEDK
jgi:hypothetical protein